ncbi:MAG: S49 family peptidase [Gemmatimonadetes bacterium]|jgi:hypothetical protein|nr:S49 family peptidase [Gemmatimonadota bacterium]
MPSWKDVLDEVKAAGSIYDATRRKYLAELHQLTGRNVIIYYSGWLQRPEQRSSVFSLTDRDKNGFMAAIYGLEREKGLDLLLHTPGGELAATESLVDYLRRMFGSNIRAVVPQLAMSAGTMIALACREVIMGKHSSLGPIDPQIVGLPAHGIIEEFVRAAEQIKADPTTIPLWQPIIAKYHPTLIGECQKAILWADQMVKDWLQSGMFANDPQAQDKADRIVRELGDHALTLSHSRHISATKAAEVGVMITPLEGNSHLQEAVLTVHHACILTLAVTPVAKIIENHNGVAYMESIGTQ